MRILTFLHSFEPGGVERVALRLVRHWREQGVDAQLFIGRDEGAMAQDIGLDLGFITPPQPSIRVAPWETLWMILTLPRAIAETQPDVLFCAGNTYAIVAVVLKLLLGRDCPPILVKISNTLERRRSNRAGRFFYDIWLRIQGMFLDHFIAIEASMAEEVGTRLDVSRSAVSIIPNPVLSRTLIERLRAMPKTVREQGEGRRFVAVGRLAAQKNLPLMLRAFAQGAEPNDRLTLIGDGPARARLEALARRLGLGDRVEFRGYVAEPALLLPEFDVLLLSSDYEGVPGVILEALAANLPIIATNCCRSMPALLMDGRLGKLVEVGNIVMFADAIARAGPGTQDEQLSLAQAERFTVDAASSAYLPVMARLWAQNRLPNAVVTVTHGRRGSVTSLQ